MSTSIFAFIIVLGVLIFFHELGHFLMARFFGVGVEKFSLGFGPRLIGKTVGMTDYRVSLIPLGGYVKMVGEEPDTEIEPYLIPRSFTHKSVFKRFLIVAAGPMANLLLAVVIFFLVFQTSGTYVLRPLVGEVDTPFGCRPGRIAERRPGGGHRRYRYYELGRNGGADIQQPGPLHVLRRRKDGTASDG